MDVKTEDASLDSPKESPCSEPSAGTDENCTPVLYLANLPIFQHHDGSCSSYFHAGFSPSFEDFEERFLEEKENLLPKKGRPHLRFEIISEDGFYTQSDSAEGKVPMRDSSCSHRIIKYS